MLSELAVSFEAIALKKINDYEDLINILGQKQVEKIFRNHAAEQLVEMSDSKAVVIPIKMNDIEDMVSVEDFEKTIDQSGFSKLYLKIDSVNIKQTWNRINDTTHIGLAEFKQEYTEMQNKNTVYHEISKINMNIKLIQISKIFGDDVIPAWKVKLGRIE